MKRPAYAAWVWGGFVLAAIALLGMCLPGSAWVATPASGDVVVERDNERESE